MIKEDFLHFLWKSHVIPKRGLLTTDNRTIDIVHTGSYNHDNGPDFIMGRIRIDGVLWAGNVEMHLKASDWYVHGHQHDKRYDNVILHVVYEYDKDVYNAGGKIPCVELKNVIKPELIRNYLALQSSHAEIPCFNYPVPHFQEDFLWMKDRLIVERLNRKIAPYLRTIQPHDVTFKQMVLEALGAQKNKDSFKTFGTRINWMQMNRWANRPELVTTYLLKLSGLFEDELKQHVLGNQLDAYVSNPLTIEAWNTKSIRPGNQPKTRVLQFAQICTQGYLMHLPNSETPTAYSQWWYEEAHRLQSEMKFSPFLLQNIAINAVIPFAYFVGVKSGESDWIDFAFEHLEEWKPERNSIILKFKAKGFTPASSSDSQAILELYRHYCALKKCVSCAVGTKLMRA